MTPPNPHPAVRWLAHLTGVAGAVVVASFAIGLTIPPAASFPDDRMAAFHTFFVGVLREQSALPERHDDDWLQRARPGDVIFVSRGHVPWGEWSHAAVVVRAPNDAYWVEPGTLAVVNASIHDGLYLSPVEEFAGWPRVALRRASEDPAVGASIARAALQARSALFTGVAMKGAPYSNCAKSVADALRAAGIEIVIPGWRTPDELYRSPVWIE